MPHAAFCCCDTWLSAALLFKATPFLSAGLFLTVASSCTHFLGALLSPLFHNLQEAIDVIRSALTLGMDKAVSGVRVDRSGNVIKPPHSNGKKGGGGGEGGGSGKAGKAGQAPAAKKQKKAAAAGEEGAAAAAAATGAAEPTQQAAAAEAAQQPAMAAAEAR